MVVSSEVGSPSILNHSILYFYHSGCNHYKYFVSVCFYILYIFILPFISLALSIMPGTCEMLS